MSETLQEKDPQNQISSSNPQQNIENPVQNQPNQPENPQTTKFNPLTHIPPKYDIYGFLKPKPANADNNIRYNILSEKDKIKIPWEENLQQSHSPMTQSKLLELRKKARIPDISYDLDKDGYVGGKDFVLSKIYDLDQDGKLNEIEKKNAYEGIKNNIESKYVWNLDNQGGNRPFRIMQKRGKLIDAEDFQPLIDTYPPHPLSKIEPKNGIKTLRELHEFRKKQNKDYINSKLKEFEQKHPVNFNKQNVNVDLQNKPEFTSMEQIKNKFHREMRKNAGLSEIETDIKNIKAPTLEYVYNPKHKTLSDIKEDFYNENLELSKKLNNQKHKSDIERLNERENEIFKNLYKSEEGMTFNKIKEKRRKETNDYNMKTFANQPIGVHGHELPKFSENEDTKEFWKFRDGYCENPPFQSQVEFLENQKFWKKNEELLINDHKDFDVWVDPYKRVYVPYTASSKKEKELITNINEVNFYKDFDPKFVKPIDYDKNKKHIYRWTTLVSKFQPDKFKGHRFFDALKSEFDDDEQEHYQLFGKDPKRGSVIMAIPNDEKKNMEKSKIEEIIQHLNEDKKKVPEKNPLYEKFANEKNVVSLAMSSNLVKSSGF
jgi:hypothetical protein